MSNGPGARARYYIDEVELYKIPTAGPNVLSCNSSAGSPITIGEGCPIPGATYAWTTSSNSTPFSTSIQTTVNPATSATYTLTVTLPDNSTFVSSVAVSISTTPSVPDFIRLVYVYNSFNSNKVYNVAVNNGPNPPDTFTLDVYNAYDPSTPIRHYSRSPYTGLDATSPQPEIQGSTTFPTGFIGPAPRTGPGSSYILVVTATSPCGSTSTTQYVTLPADDNTGGGEESSLTSSGGSQSELTAYPNPASERLILPARTQEAVLLNRQGDVVSHLKNVSEIDVHKLPAGIYNLQTRYKGKVLNQQIQIKR